MRQSQSNVDVQGQEGHDFLPGCNDWDDSKVVAENNKRNKKVRQFKIPDSEKHLKDVANEKFAVQSQKKMRWMVKLYDGWRVNCLKTTVAGPQRVNADLDKILQFNKSDLSYSL